MTFPISAFLIAYFIFLVFFAIFAYFDIYHVLKFGTLNFTNFLATFIFFGVTTLILFLTYQYINQIDWTTPVSLFQGVSFNSISY